nr:thiamine phosphate synthase [uncultured Blautia sp.]
MKFSREMLLLYAVTDRKWTGEKTLYRQVEEALKGGATLIQLREKNMPQEEFLKEAREMAALCHRYGTALIINDNVEVALKSGADGVHVGMEDLPVKEIRKQVPGDFIIGATAKTTEQAQRAEKEGADYLGVGAVFPSSTKKNAIRITTEELKKICSSVRIPAVAIGGITSENAGTLVGGGMAGMALVSAVFGASDIERETAGLKKKIQEVVSL